MSAAKPALALPDKPSIAVLPFTNLSGDPKRTTSATASPKTSSRSCRASPSSSSSLATRASNTRASRRTSAKSAASSASATCSKAASAAPATACASRRQLIDATTGAHRWAERYDRELKDIFAVQDELARTIAVILAAHLNKAETERALLKAPTTWRAYDYYMRAAGTFASFWSSMLIGELYETRRLLEAAIELDANYARPYTTLSFTYIAAAQNRVDDDFMKSCRASPSPSARTQGHPGRSKLARCPRRARCRLDMDKWSKRCQCGSL